MKQEINDQITELRLQQQCFVYYWNNFQQYRGILFMLHNTPQNAIKAGQLIGAGMVKGTPDMLLLKPNGKYIFLEFKNGTKQSIFQKWFQKIVEVMQGNYVIITSLDQFKKILHENLPTVILPPMP